MLSISACEIVAMPTWLVARIASNSASRSSSVSTFESASPFGTLLEVEHHRRRHDRPGERPAPDLVDAGDGAAAAAQQMALVPDGELGPDHGRACA